LISIFCNLRDLNKIKFTDLPVLFREEEGFAVILRRQMANKLNLNHSFIAAWITLTVYSSLQAAGFITAFSKLFLTIT